MPSRRRLPAVEEHEEHDVIMEDSVKMLDKLERKGEQMVDGGVDNFEAHWAIPQSQREMMPLLPGDYLTAEELSQSIAEMSESSLMSEDEEDEAPRQDPDYIQTDETESSGVSDDTGEDATQQDHVKLKPSLPQQAVEVQQRTQLRTDMNPVPSPFSQRPRMNNVHGWLMGGEAPSPPPSEINIPSSSPPQLISPTSDISAPWPRRSESPGILVRGAGSGRWSSREIHLADKIWNDYVQSKCLNEHELRCTLQSWRNVSSDFKALMYDAFPDRYTKKIVRFCQRRFKPRKVGPWTEEEDRKLRAVSRSLEDPSVWVAYGENLKRYPRDVEKRWREIQDMPSARRGREVQERDQRGGEDRKRESGAKESTERTAKSRKANTVWSDAEQSLLCAVVYKCCMSIGIERSLRRATFEQLTRLLDWEGIRQSMVGYGKTAQKYRERWEEMASNIKSYWKGKIADGEEMDASGEGLLEFTRAEFLKQPFPTKCAEHMSWEETRVEKHFSMLAVGDVFDALRDVEHHVKLCPDVQFANEEAVWSWMATFRKSPYEQRGTKYDDYPALRRRAIEGALQVLKLDPGFEKAKNVAAQIWEVLDIFDVCATALDMEFPRVYRAAEFGGTHAYEWEPLHLQNTARADRERRRKFMLDSRGEKGWEYGLDQDFVLPKKPADGNELQDGAEEETAASWQPNTRLAAAPQPIPGGSMAPPPPPRQQPAPRQESALQQQPQVGSWQPRTRRIAARLPNPVMSTPSPVDGLRFRKRKRVIYETTEDFEVGRAKWKLKKPLKKKKASRQQHASTIDVFGIEQAAADAQRRIESERQSTEYSMRLVEEATLSSVI